MGSLLLDVTIKGTLVLLATCAAAFALRRASAATRHVVWTVGMAAALALPMLSQLLPTWTVDILPTRAIAGPAAAAPAAGEGIEIEGLLALVWLAGAAVVLASIALGRLRIWWIARGSAPLDRGEIPALTTALCGALGISRRVSVRLCPDRMMPMVWGVLRPVILLPAEATKWTADLQRDVLLHELAHVRRHDYLNQLVTRLACAVHWFNPLAWMAARRVRAERERACDDHVLDTGASACDYAEHLVAVARRLRPAGRGTLGVAMAGRSAFGERVAALLDGRRARGVLTGALLARSGIGAACLVIPLAALHPGGREATPEPPAQIVGPPPSANARAGGALPPSGSAPARSEAPTPARTPRPAPEDDGEPGAARASRRTVVLLQAPAVRAVFRTVGSGADLEMVVVPDAGDGTSTECSDSHTSPARNAASATETELVWVPSGGAMP
ncbi:MAG TPA: M56 family metallopeptidase [Gemmatimonadota bacterium]|nr:M56 family metallopeptidase [Gemmatimonadota bacterium]